MKTKFKEILRAVFFLSAFAYITTVFIYWVMNPDLNQMQIFLKIWYWFVINIILSIWVTKINNN